jgi:hypothetical protein
VWPSYPRAAPGIEDRSDPADLRAKLVASKIIDLSLLGETVPTGCVSGR